MEDKQFCCEAAAARLTKQLTLPDGIRVGIINLDTIIKETAVLKLTDIEAVKKELLQRVKMYNYILSGAESEYSVSLFREYQQQSGNIKGEDT
jgi:hypothetical protein